MRQYKSPLFQQRHYEWLAAFLRNETRYHEASDYLAKLVRRLEYELKADNAKFKPARFETAVYDNKPTT